VIRLARNEELLGPFLADPERLTGLAVALHIIGAATEQGAILRRTL
jgi:hypothetical protein